MPPGGVLAPHINDHASWQGVQLPQNHQIELSMIGDGCSPQSQGYQNIKNIKIWVIIINDLLVDGYGPYSCLSFCKLSLEHININ